MHVILGLCLCALCAAKASRKGLSPVLWFLAGGPVGYLLLACLPAANVPEQSEQQQRRARWIGNCTAAFLLLAVIGLFIALAASR